MKRNGFTLIELLIILVLIILLAGIAIPGYSRWMPDIRLKGVVRDLKSDMELSKLRAIRENANVALIFDTASDSYVIFVDNGIDGGVAGDWIQNGSEPTVKTVSLPRDVDMYESSFSGGLSRTRFNGRAVPPGFGGHVYFKNSKNNYRGITLNMIGRVRIQTSDDGGVTWTEAD